MSQIVSSLPRRAVLTGAATSRPLSDKKAEFVEAATEQGADSLADESVRERREGSSMNMGKSARNGEPRTKITRHKRQVDYSPAVERLLALPFVRNATPAECRAEPLRRRIFWDVKPTGDYGADCKTGKQYCLLALDYMVREKFPGFLTWVVTDMIRSGKERSGIEVGFLSTFGAYAMAMYGQPHMWLPAVPLDKAPSNSRRTRRDPSGGN